MWLIYSLNILCICYNKFSDLTKRSRRCGMCSLSSQSDSWAICSGWKQINPSTQTLPHTSWSAGIPNHSPPQSHHCSYVHSLFSTTTGQEETKKQGSSHGLQSSLDPNHWYQQDLTLAVDLISRDFMQGKINSLGELIVLLRNFYRTQMPVMTRNRRRSSRKIMGYKEINMPLNKSEVFKSIGHNVFQLRNLTWPLESPLNHWTVTSENARIENEVLKDWEKVNRISSSAKQRKQN